MARTASRRGTALVVCLAVVFGPLLVAPATGADRSRAGVVVEHGDGSVETDCVRFSGELTGYQLLKESRFALKAAQFSFGRAICWLDGEGCRTTNPEKCFCDPSDFWGYWTQKKGRDKPKPADVGAGDRIVRNGDVDYWIWSNGSSPPDAKKIGAICN